MKKLLPFIYTIPPIQPSPALPISTLDLESLVGSHSDGVVPSVESDELRFEHDVAIDLEAGGRGLESAEAGYCFVSLYFWEKI